MVGSGDAVDADHREVRAVVDEVDDAGPAVSGRPRQLGSGSSDPRTQFGRDRRTRRLRKHSPIVAADAYVAPTERPDVAVSIRQDVDLDVSNCGALGELLAEPDDRRDRRLVGQPAHRRGVRPHDGHATRLTGFDQVGPLGMRPRAQPQRVDAGLLKVKYFMSFYIGGMGAKSTNFHKDLFVRLGYEAEAEKIQQLFMEDKRDEAARVLPDELVDAMSLVGPKDRIKDRLQAWRDSKVTTILVAAADQLGSLNSY